MKKLFIAIGVVALFAAVLSASSSFAGDLPEYTEGFILPCGKTEYHTFLHEPTADELMTWEAIFEAQDCGGKTNASIIANP